MLSTISCILRSWLRKHGGFRDRMETDQLKRAVEGMYGGSARLAQSAPVEETHEGKAVWEGVVHIFDLEGHSTASKAYAWSSPIEGSDKRRSFAVLHRGPLKSPADAVQAAIVQEHQAKG
jgi:hypothetical protein